MRGIRAPAAPMRGVGLAALCAAWAAAHGCEPSGATPGAYEVRDSAGVRIVAYPGAPTPSATLTLSAEPLYRYGDDEAEYAFAGIGAGALRPDGSAVVADMRNAEVIAIAADGSSHAVLAGPGQGPGEVRLPRSVTVLGPDTVLVEDDGNGRLVWFVGGRLARSESQGGEPSFSRGLAVRGVDGRGRLLLSTSSYRSRFDEPWLQGHMVVHDVEAGTVDTVAAYDMASRRPTSGPENPFAPFGFGEATGTGFVQGRSDVPELVWRGADGAVRQVLRWQPERTYPTEEIWTAFLEGLRRDLPRVNPGLPEERLKALIDQQVARYRPDPGAPLPLWGTLDGDDRGRVWLSAFVPGPSLVGVPRYTVVSEDGVWLGTVDCPPGFRLLDAANGRVLAVITDAMDVQSVAVFDLAVRPGGG